MNEKKLFRIGEVAKMFHISMGTLRHYEQEGILTPEYTDERTGYRYYSTRQFEVLNTIRYLRVLDIPLSEIGEFLKNGMWGITSSHFWCWMRKTATRVRQKNYWKPDVLPYVFVEVTGKLVYTIRNCWIILMHTDCRLPDFPERSR